MAGWLRIRAEHLQPSPQAHTTRPATTFRASPSPTVASGWGHALLTQFKSFRLSLPRAQRHRIQAPRLSQFPSTHRRVVGREGRTRSEVGTSGMELREVAGPTPVTPTRNQGLIRSRFLSPCLDKLWDIAQSWCIKQKRLRFWISYPTIRSASRPRRQPRSGYRPDPSRRRGAARRAGLLALGPVAANHLFPLVAAGYETKLEPSYRHTAALGGLLLIRGL